MNCSKCGLPLPEAPGLHDLICKGKGTAELLKQRIAALEAEVRLLRHRILTADSYIEELRSQSAHGSFVPDTDIADMTTCRQRYEEAAVEASLRCEVERLQTVTTTGVALPDQSIVGRMISQVRMLVAGFGNVHDDDLPSDIADLQRTIEEYDAVVVTCPHASWTGIDKTSLDDPWKVFRCDACGILSVESAEPADDEPTRFGMTIQHEPVDPELANLRAFIEAIMDEVWRHGGIDGGWAQDRPRS
jgi:hypothetical protein